MKPRFDVRTLYPANLFRPSSRFSSAASSAHRGICNTGVLAVGLLALMGSGKDLSAQQQDWPPDDPYPSNQTAGLPQSYPAQPYGYGAQPQYQQPAYPSPQQPYSSAYPQQGYGQQLAQAQPVSPDELTQLIAPIALYPDALVAQILAASTYPAQIAAANQWLRSLGNASPEQIAAGADAQASWDPSIKALTAFPQILGMLNQNLQWTTNLGNAYYNQPQDVLQTIQVMRQRAEDAGNLQSTPQEQVTENQGAIDIAPTDPQVVYVPTYNPWNVYGQPVDPYPGFSFFGALGDFFGASPVQFGLSFAMSAFLHTPWGFLGWGLDWLAHSVLFNHDSYYSQSRSVSDWGFPHGGPRAYPGSAQFAHGGYGFQRGSNNGGWGNSGSARNGYAPRYGGGAEFNRGYGQGWQRYGDARSAEGFNRGFPPPTRSPQEAYNRYPQAIGRPQQFGNGYDQRQYGSSSGRSGSSGYPGYGSPRDGYAGRSGSGYASPSPAYRMPENNYRGSTGRTYNAYRGNEFSGSQRGGFHLFGGGHSSSSYGGSAPKSYSYGGHSSWGGGGWKAPKESHFGGGGHSGGGGGHSSGHSGGHHH
jgi:hypothetical protein